jgi:hypothetical protein
VSVLAFPFTSLPRVHFTTSATRPRHVISPSRPPLRQQTILCIRTRGDTISNHDGAQVVDKVPPRRRDPSVVADRAGETRRYVVAPRAIRLG